MILVVLAGAQWNLGPLGLAIAGLLIIALRKPLSRLDGDEYQARFSLLNRERAEEIERWSREDRPALQRVYVVAVGLVLVGVGLGLFLGILPSD